MRPTTGLAIALLSLLLCAPSVPASETYKPPPEENKPPRVTVYSLYQAKCAKCHPISKPDGAFKSIDEWKTAVSRMRDKDQSWISQDDADKIAQFLAGRTLCQKKCVKCHTADRIGTQKTVLQWQNTVDRMQGKDPAWISDADKKQIIFYLTDVNLLEVDY
jgi:hypothetical protein